LSPTPHTRRLVAVQAMLCMSCITASISLGSGLSYGTFPNFWKLKNVLEWIPLLLLFFIQWIDSWTLSGATCFQSLLNLYEPLVASARALVQNCSNPPSKSPTYQASVFWTFEQHVHDINMCLFSFLCMCVCLRWTCMPVTCTAVMSCRGVINSMANKGTPSCPIIQCCTAVGHSKAVLSLFAVDDLLFTGSKGRYAFCCASLFRIL